MQNNLPYLPELESVDNRGSKSGAFAAAFALLSITPTLAAVIYGAVFYREYMDAAGYALSGLILLLLLALPVRWLFSMDVIETGADSITLRGPIRRRVIPWGSVLQASALRSPLGYTVKSIS